LWAHEHQFIVSGPPTHTRQEADVLLHPSACCCFEIRRATACTRCCVCKQMPYGHTVLCSGPAVACTASARQQHMMLVTKNCADAPYASSCPPCHSCPWTVTWRGSWRAATAPLTHRRSRWQRDSCCHCCPRCRLQCAAVHDAAGAGESHEKFSTTACRIMVHHAPSFSKPAVL
jgi:hypothetical protein